MGMYSADAVVGLHANPIASFAGIMTGDAVVPDLKAHASCAQAMGLRPAQEILLIPGETKSILMKSNTVLYSAAFLEQGTYHVFKVRQALEAGSAPMQILDKH